MLDIGAWNAVADAVAAVPDQSRTHRLVDALRRIGMPPAERHELMAAILGRQDPAGLVLANLVAVPTDETGPVAVLDTPAPAADTDRALVVAGRMRTTPVDALSDSVSKDEVELLDALPAEAAGALVLDLIQRSLALTDPAARTVGLQFTVVVAGHATAARLPVADLLRSGAGRTGEDQRLLGRVIGRAGSERLLRGVAQALSGGADPGALAALLDVVAAERPALPPVVRRQGQASVDAEPPVFRAGPPDGAAPPPTMAPLPAPSVPAADNPFSQPTPFAADDGADDASAGRTAYPRIDLTTNTDRKDIDVVLVDAPFTATIGLSPRPSRTLLGTGQISTPAGTTTELEAVLIYDPASITPSGPTRFTLTVTDQTPFPVQQVELKAVFIPSGPLTRRLGVHLLRDGQVVGVAFRSFAVADDKQGVASAVAPPAPDTSLLEVSSPLTEGAPDLVVAVNASDGSERDLVWTAYATSADLTVPDAPSRASLQSDISAFALDTRRLIQFSGDRVADFFNLRGRALLIGASVPEVIQSTLRELVAQPGRTTAPSVLLLTEEPVIPWEIAVFATPLETPWGGTAPFLGAHVAIGRWPLVDGDPRPVPRSTVSVSRGAVVTADYTGVPGWGKLAAAQAEATSVADLFDPRATEVEPVLLDVLGLLRGTPPADILHVALHGQFDNQGTNEGIVLVTTDAAGARKAQFLTPDIARNGKLAHGPFVFLNACQVGADERVLGGYGGFATTLLQIGASAVVAPLWNIDDDVAARIASTFYTATWTASDPVGIGEAMRAIRATYTEEAVLAGTAGISATLIAFQVFGNPRMTLVRTT